MTCFWALISPQIVSGYDARPSLVLAVILASVSIAALAATFVRHTSGVRIVVAGLIAIDVVVVWHCAGLLGWRGP